MRREDARLGVISAGHYPLSLPLPNIYAEVEGPCVGPLQQGTSKLLALQNHDINGRFGSHGRTRA